MELRHSRWVRPLRARPRLVIMTLVVIMVYVFLPVTVAEHAVTRALIAWNTGTVLYLMMAGVMMARSAEAAMKRRASLQDDGQLVILGLVVLASVASLAAIAFELAVVRDAHGLLKTLHVLLAGTTVLSSWAFIQTMFCLHYAHDFYAPRGQGHAGGLLFPDTERPSYGDFFYFAVVIGTSGQTADVSFSSRPMRRVGTVHCILAYLYNTMVLALLINIAAGLL
jgi:uncharacterized membrane protein